MLRDKMPSIYTSSGMMLSLFDAEETQLTLFHNSVDGRLDQASVNTATTTIERWEKEFGLPKSNLPLEQRRAAVISKIRGYGTVTVSHIKNMCNAYTNGNVDVIQHHADHYFEIKFNSVRGIPPNMDDLKRVINQIKPAHLGVTYIYLYTTWDRVDSFNYTWDQFDALNKTWDEIEVM